MVNARYALADLELAMKNWYEVTGQSAPDIGVLVIGLSREGCDLQYLGKEPNAVIDWPTLFTRILEEIADGRYVITDATEVKFRGQR